MRKVLTFDTCLDKTYVVLSNGDKILSSQVIENHNEKYHSAFLIPAIVSMLKENSLTMKDIDAIGTNVGPGSFTGIRACVTVARVFAQQLNVPLVGVCSLEILSRINDSEKDTFVVLDARKNQFYTAIYSRDEKEISKPQLTNKEDLLKNNFDKYYIVADESSNNVLREIGIESVIYTDVHAQLGLFLNQIVNKKLDDACDDEYMWAKLKPLYLQAPPVTISAKSKVQ